MLLVTALAEAVHVVGYLVLGHALRDGCMAVPALGATAEAPEVRPMAHGAVLVGGRSGWVDGLLVTTSAGLLGVRRLMRLMAGAARELHGRGAAEGDAGYAHPAVAREA